MMERKKKAALLEARHKAVQRCAQLHVQLNSVMRELRGLALDNERAARALSVSLTEAESSFLWMRSAAEQLGVEL